MTKHQRDERSKMLFSSASTVRACIIGRRGIWGCPALLDALTLLLEVFPCAQESPPYSAEFHRQMVGLVRAGRSPEYLAHEFEPTAQSIGNWVAQADKQEGCLQEAAPGLLASERDELTRVNKRRTETPLESGCDLASPNWFPITHKQTKPERQLASRNGPGAGRSGFKPPMFSHAGSAAQMWSPVGLTCSQPSGERWASNWSGTFSV